jgi:uncharacterized repeat protein (TIGR01451 family)
MARLAPFLPGSRWALGVGVAAAFLLLLPPASAQDRQAESWRESPSAAGERYLQEQEEQKAREPRERTAQPPAVVEEQEVRPAPLVLPAAPTPGADIIVNDPTDDTPESTTQSETTLAVLGDTVCAGYNNSGPGGFSGLSRSTDLGGSWADLGGIGQSGDPVIVAHRATGRFYYAEIATIGGNPAIGVARSNTDCQSFTAPVNASPVASGLNTTTLNDKPWIAVDNTGGTTDGNVYVCWTRFICLDVNNQGIANCTNGIDDDGDGQIDEGSSELRFSRSTDGGASYVNEQILQPGGTAPFGCSIGVGPTGQVYVAWADRAGATQDNIRFRSSNDAGQNFAAAVNVSTGNRHPGTDNVIACGPNNNRPTLNGSIRMLHQAWLAVDATGGPFNGNIYVVWASDPAMAGTDQSDVFFSRSTNGGGMWSAPVQLGGGGGQTDQFEPFVAVAGAGALSVAWYDRRNDAANNLNVDVYKAFSSDGGANFGALVRVTDQSFPVPPLNPNFDPGVARCYMGEYIAATGDEHNFYYLWGDNRNTLVTTAFPNGRPDPDVFFELEVAPVVNDVDLEIEKSDTPDPVVAGEQLTYTLEARNAGPDIALDVVITDTLPSAVDYVSDDGGCDTTALPTLTCSLGNLVNGASRTIHVTVKVKPDAVFNGTTILTNTADISGVGNESDATDNHVTEQTQVVAVADVAILSFGAVNPPGEVMVGANVPLTLRKEITNLGPSGPVNTRLTVTATAPPDSTVTPTNAVHDEPALGLNEVRVVDEVFTIRCGKASNHTFSFQNTIEALGATDPNLTNNQKQTSVDVTCVVPIVLNIKPGSFPNSINPHNRGVIPLAVLTTTAGQYGTPVSFDATKINPLSVRFGPRSVVEAGGGAVEAHGRGHVEDSFELDERTRDGDRDMVLHFRTQQTGIQPGHTEACVKGSFTDNTGTHAFFGCDSIRTVPPGH